MKQNRVLLFQDLKIPSHPIAHSGLGLAMAKPGCWRPLQGPPEVSGYQQGELCIGQREAA